MKFSNPYWSKTTKLELLQKWILVHSCIYYDLNTNIVDDNMFDMNSKQLAEAIARLPETHKKTKWYEAFKDFDGSSGFDLMKKLPHSQRVEIGLVAARLVDELGDRR